jgi:hypothetical protein
LSSMRQYSLFKPFIPMQELYLIRKDILLLDPSLHNFDMGMYTLMIYMMIILIPLILPKVLLLLFT